MDKQKTASKILETIGIDASHIDLVGKVLDLEDDTTRVHSVSLTHGTIGYPGLYVEVMLFEQFSSDRELAEYLEANGLSPRDILTNRDKNSYFFFEERVKVGFIRPDFYPDKH